MISALGLRRRARARPCASPHRPRRDRAGIDHVHVRPQREKGLTESRARLSRWARAYFVAIELATHVLQGHAPHCICGCWSAHKSRQENEIFLTDKLKGWPSLGNGRFRRVQAGRSDGDAFDPRPKADGELHLFAVPFAADDLPASPLGVAHPLALGEEVVLRDKLVEARRLLGIRFVVYTLGSLFAGRRATRCRERSNRGQLVILGRRLGGAFALK